MMRRTGAPGCSTDLRANGPSRGPQLPWGSCCIRKTFWRLPVLHSDRHRHASRSREFSGSPPPTARYGFPSRTILPCHRTIKEPSARAALSSFSTCLPNREKAYFGGRVQSNERFSRQKLSTVNVENMLSEGARRVGGASDVRSRGFGDAGPPVARAAGSRRDTSSTARARPAAENSFENRPIHRLSAADRDVRGGPRARRRGSA